MATDRPRDPDTPDDPYRRQPPETRTPPTSSTPPGPEGPGGPDTSGTPSGTEPEPPAKPLVNLPGIEPSPPAPPPPAGDLPPPPDSGENASPAPPPRRMGRITVQQEGVTQPRPPTVAEARAREKARKRAEEQAAAAAEADEAKKTKKKKLLIGSAAVVGIAALVGGGYLAYSALTTPNLTAYCTVVAQPGEVVPIGNGQTVTATTKNQEIVVPDNYCSDARSHGTVSTGHSDVFLLAGHSYRYYYGGTNTIGRAPTGGSTVLPKGANVKTKSGTTIQRGGLGTKVGSGGS